MAIVVKYLLMVSIVFLMPGACSRPQALARVLSLGSERCRNN
jgi:hypothetical protein